jgi:hypothetical protein
MSRAELVRRKAVNGTQAKTKGTKNNFAGAFQHVRGPVIAAF